MQYRGGRPGWSARISNRVSAIAFAVAIGPGHAATLEVRGHKTGGKISFPVVVADYHGDRYRVAMLGHKTNWVRNLRADEHAVLLMHRKRENVSLFEDLSGERAAVLRGISTSPPAHAHSFPIDRRAPIGDCERIVNDYPVFRVV